MRFMMTSSGPGQAGDGRRRWVRRLRGGDPVRCPCPVRDYRHHGGEQSSDGLQLAFGVGQACAGG